MIISRRHRFIFVAIPKTGTHSIRQALREHLGPEDQEQVGLFVQRALPIPDLAKLRHGHITLAQLEPHLPPEEFKNFFKFAFVRNPFDRFISYCAFMTRQSGQFHQSPQAVMRHFITNPPRNHILFQPQTTYIEDAQGNLLSDFVGRVETMQLSFDEVSRRLGLDSAPLAKVNTSRRDNYRGYYTDDGLIAGVAKLYEHDLKVFGYEF